MLAERRDKRWRVLWKSSPSTPSTSGELAQAKFPRKRTASIAASASDPKVPRLLGPKLFCAMAANSGNNVRDEGDEGASKRTEEATRAEYRYKEPMRERGTSAAFEGRSSSSFSRGSSLVMTASSSAG